MKFKNIIIIAILGLCLVSLVSAEDLVLSPSKTTYNLGEQLRLVGKIDIYSAEDNSSKLNVLKIDLEGPTVREVAKFNIQFESGSVNLVRLNNGIPIFVNLADLEIGDYKIAIKIGKSENDTVRTVYSQQFNISNQLKLSWDTDRSTAALGDTVKIAGAALLQDDNSLASEIEVTLLNETYKYNSGSFQITKKIDKKVGEVIIQIKDKYGNHVEDKVPLDLQSALKINLPSEFNGDPGDSIPLSTRVENFRGEPVTFKAELLFEGNKHSTTGTGTMTYELPIPADMPPGSKELFIEINDDYGNNAKQKIRIYVAEILAEFTMDINKGKYLEGDTLKYEIVAKDQTGSPTSRGVTLKLVSSDGEEFGETSINTALERIKTGEFKLPEKTGEWKFIATAEGKTVSKDLKIVERNAITGLFFGQPSTGSYAIVVLFLIALGLVGWFILERAKIAPPILHTLLSSLKHKIMRLLHLDKLPSKEKAVPTTYKGRHPKSKLKEQFKEFFSPLIKLFKPKQEIITKPLPKKIKLSELMKKKE